MAVTTCAEGCATRGMERERRCIVRNVELLSYVQTESPAVLYDRTPALQYLSMQKWP
jgi:hypothetical protein